MDILQPNEYELARPLFQGMDQHLAIEAILNGFVPGTVYLDDRKNPTLAAAWFSHRFHLAAAPGVEVDYPHLNRFFQNEIIPAAVEKKMEGFLIFYSEGVWAEQIPASVFPEKKIYPGEREYYEISSVDTGWRRNLPAGFSLCEVDRWLLEDDTIENLDWLLEETTSERESVGAFLENSFGSAILYDNMLVAWCLSEYNSGSRCEVGIATADAYQKRGLGTVVGSAFVEQAIARGYNQIGWHCWKRNIPSWRTALRIGYHKTRDYPTYYVPVVEEEN
ncbi:MAG: GNAT family N-acetyltransferase [Chloroflexi bacterium]|nr:MAG: GNAT family N-acetyltransferase [Chloroflexota bacterium]